MVQDQQHESKPIIPEGRQDKHIMLEIKWGHILIQLQMDVHHISIWNKKNTNKQLDGALIKNYEKNAMV